MSQSPREDGRRMDLHLESSLYISCHNGRPDLSTTICHTRPVHVSKRYVSARATVLMKDLDNGLWLLWSPIPAGP